MSDTAKGICFAIIGAISIALMGVFVKFIGTSTNNLTILFFRFIISLVILLPIICRDKNFSFKIRFPLYLSLRLIFGITAIACYFYAIQHIKLVNAILLGSTYPIFVPIIIFILTRQKTNKKVVLGILVSFVGIILVLNPGRDIFQSTYSLIGLTSGIFMAVAYVFLRAMLSRDRTQLLNLLFYFFLVGAIISLPYMIIHWQPLTTFQWTCLIGVGLFGYGYQFCQTKALQFASLRVISPLIYISVLVGGVFDWIIWDTTMSYLTLTGAIITITGAIIVILNRNRLNY